MSRASHKRIRVLRPFKMHGYVQEPGRELVVRKTLARALSTSGRARILPEKDPVGLPEARERKVVAHVERKVVEPETKAEDGQCRGVTASGNQCKRKGRFDGFCSAHSEQK